MDVLAKLSGGAVPKCLSGSRNDILRGGACLGQVLNLIDKQFFLFGMTAVFGLAFSWPHLGAQGGPMRPEFVVDRLAVKGLFFLSGLALPLRGLLGAVSAWRVNTLIQSFSLGAMPLLALALTRCLEALAPNILQPDTLSGLVVLGSVPTTSNMCVVLSAAANADVPAAIFNAVFGNLLGVVVTPLLLRALLPTFRSTDSSLATPAPSLSAVFRRLTIKVVTPIACGVVTATLLPPKLRALKMRRKKLLSRLSELLLLLVVHNAFSDAFSSSVGIEPSEVCTLLAVLIVYHTTALVSVFGLGSEVLKLEPAQTVTAMLCGSHKTVALGLPLLKSILGAGEGSGGVSQESLALLFAPLLLYHPLQLVLDSLLVPTLQKLTTSSAERA